MDYYSKIRIKGSRAYSLESIKPKISIKIKQEKYQKWLTDNTEKIVNIKN